MGDKDPKAFQLSFNGFRKVDFQGSRVTSDGGLLLVRELDERLGLGKRIDEHLSDSRQVSQTPRFDQGLMAPFGALFRFNT